MYAVRNAEIICPDIDIPTDNTLSYLVTSISLFFSGCSGLPYWVYILVFVPLAIVLLAYLTPFIG